MLLLRFKHKLAGKQKILDHALSRMWQNVSGMFNEYGVSMFENWILMMCVTVLCGLTCLYWLTHMVHSDWHGFLGSDWPGGSVTGELTVTDRDVWPDSWGLWQMYWQWPTQVRNRCVDSYWQRCMTKQSMSMTDCVCDMSWQWPTQVKSVTGVLTVTERDVVWPNSRGLWQIVRVTDALTMTNTGEVWQMCW